MKLGYLLVPLALLVLGCTTTRAPVEKHSFSFVHDGGTYEIVGVGDGSNYLILRGGERITMRARDSDRDGTLDTLLAGGITLAQANAVYAFGIAEAKARGKVEVQAPTRVYTLTQPEGSYAVLTYMLGPARAYNRFIVYDPFGQQRAEALDAEADGTLNQIERGDAALDHIQNVYDMVLNKGLREGRIEHVEGRYTVKQATSRATET